MDYIIAHWGYLSVAHSQFTLLYMDLFFYRNKILMVGKPTRKKGTSLELLSNFPHSSLDVCVVFCLWIVVLFVNGQLFPSPTICFLEGTTFLFLTL
jgi:hypothetical protein